MAVFRGDPCGIFCVLLTYAAVLYADYVVVRWIVMISMSESLWGPLNAFLFNTVAFLCLMSHLRAVCSDPGVIPLPKNKIDFSDLLSGPKHLDAELVEKDNWTVCGRCETYRPPRAHHCRICQRCVRRMDHHCPWINNCVGEWNQKYFIQFLMYVGVLSVYAVTLVVLSWVVDCPHCPKEETIKQSRMLHSVLLVLESILFGIFVVAIMADQLQAVLTDETAVEQVKRQGPYRPRKPKMALLSEVCGRGPPLFWIFPCHNPPRSGASVGHYDV